MRPAQDHRLAATIAEVDRLRVQVAQLQREQRLGVVEIPLPSVRWVVEAVAAEWGVTPTTILSVRRAPVFVEPRQVVMWIASHHLRHSLPRIGRCLLRDHTTVMHGARVVAARMLTEPEFTARVQRVVAAIPTTLSEVQ